MAPRKPRSSLSSADSQTAQRKKRVCPRDGCNKIAMNAGDIEDHIAYEHEGITKYQCWCGQRFGYRSNLGRHQKTHKEGAQKRVRCKRCGECAPGSRPDNFKRSHIKSCCNPSPDGKWKRDFVVEVSESLGSSEQIVEPHLPATNPVQDQDDEMAAVDHKCELSAQLQSICNPCIPWDMIMLGADLVAAVAILQESPLIDVPNMAEWTYQNLFDFALKLLQQ